VCSDLVLIGLQIVQKSKRSVTAVSARNYREKIYIHIFPAKQQVCSAHFRSQWDSCPLSVKEDSVLVKDENMMDRTRVCK
jgi:hypothetical protein